MSFNKSISDEKDIDDNEKESQDGNVPPLSGEAKDAFYWGIFQIGLQTATTDQIIALLPSLQGYNRRYLELLLDQFRERFRARTGQHLVLPEPEEDVVSEVYIRTLVIVLQRSFPDDHRDEKLPGTKS